MPARAQITRRHEAGWPFTLSDHSPTRSVKHGGAKHIQSKFGRSYVKLFDAFPKASPLD
jgi:hypothetical protein